VLWPASRAYASIVVEAMEIEVSAPGASAEQATDAQALLAVAADPVRWRVLGVLADGGTHCVCELQPVAGVAPNVLSYHLKVMREAGLVTAAKRGRWVDYTLVAGTHARLAAALPTSGTSGSSDQGAGRWR
jgi:ArsR family transcriptional regulator